MAGTFALMISAYLSLGSNQGDRYGWLQQAIELLNREAGKVVAVSKVYQTAAWGMENQDDFLNMCLCVHTALTAEELLFTIRNIETRLGRQRTIKWGPRTLDIDILLYGNEIWDTGELVIPHPHMQDRQFVLRPLADIAPMLQHPTLRHTIAELLEVCPDKLDVLEWN